MKTVKVSEEFLMSLYNECGCEVRRRIKSELPELFEKEFKVGDWVVVGGDNDYSINPSGSIGVIYEMNDIDCNVDCGNRERNKIGDFHAYHNLRHATPEEIKAHLTKEAERRGLLVTEDTRMKHPDGDVVIYAFIKTSPDSLVYYPRRDVLSTLGAVLYKQGQWATIVEDTIEMTLDEALKRLEGEIGKKIKIVLK